MIPDLESLEEGEFFEPYSVNVRALKNILSWLKNKAMAMEDEVMASLKKFLEKKFGLGVVEYPRRICDPQKMLYPLTRCISINHRVPKR
jgi:hypothetical protein